VFSRIPKRFSLRLLFVFLVVASATAFLVCDYIRLRDARARFDRMSAGWRAVRVTDDDLILASDELARIEGASPWISTKVANGHHILRLQQLVDFLTSGTCESSPEAKQRRLSIIHGNIRHLSRD
jgi:hypothetical protein